MKEKIEIPLSKSKLFLGLIGSILFIGLGVWLFLIADSAQEYSYRFMKNPIVIKGAGILTVLIFGSTGVFGVKKFFDKKVGLTIDENGITDNSNTSSVGLIEWNDITNIKVEQVASSKFLMIMVKNPEEYIEKAENIMRTKIMRSNMKMYGTPLSISSGTLKYNFEKLEQLMQTEFERNNNVG